MSERKEGRTGKAPELCFRTATELAGLVLAIARAADALRIHVGWYVPRSVPGDLSVRKRPLPGCCAHLYPRLRTPSCVLG